MLPLMFMLLHRYKFESNSQLTRMFCCRPSRCLCYYIDTSLKAIHNVADECTVDAPMFMLLHRYKFESNSQLGVEWPTIVVRCLCYYIDTSLKAIHNQHGFLGPRLAMFMLLHRYKSESNSQPPMRSKGCQSGC